MKIDSCILAQKSTNKLSFTLNQSAYEFKQNNNLKGINWFLNLKLHNDTLLGISLRVHEDLSSNNKINLNKVYQETIKEYSVKYGKPNYSIDDFDKYWFIKNLEIHLVKTDKSIFVYYENTRHRREINWQKCRFDDDYNSQDSLYYEKKHKDGIINKDI